VAEGWLTSALGLERSEEGRPVIFQIRCQPLLWPILILFGVVPGRAFVALDDDRLSARFGFFSADVALASVERWTITGPYRWWRAAGVRATIGRAELTFGGSTHGGLCLFLREPVRIARMALRSENTSSQIGRWEAAEAFYLSAAQPATWADLVVAGVP